MQILQNQCTVPIMPARTIHLQYVKSKTDTRDLYLYQLVNTQMNKGSTVRVVKSQFHQFLLSTNMLMFRPFSEHRGHRESRHVLYTQELAVRCHMVINFPRSHIHFSLPIWRWVHCTVVQNILITFLFHIFISTVSLILHVCSMYVQCLLCYVMSVMFGCLNFLWDQ